MIDAAVGACAHRVIAVTPWFGYSRQDKKSAPREPISARLVAAHARGGRRRPRADDGPPRRPDPGLLPQPGRPHDRAVHAHAVLRRPRPHRPRRRRARRRPREAQQEVRLQARRRAGDPRQGAPRPAGRRDRLRDRRRQGQDRGHRRRHHRHRRARCAPPRRRSSTRAPRASTPPPRTPILSGNAYENLAASGRSSRSSSPTRSRSAPARPTTSRVLSLRGAADRLDPPDLHRRLASSRSSAARTSCSDLPRSASSAACSWNASASPRTSCARRSTPTR